LSYFSNHGQIVSANQSTFIKGRHLVDSYVVVNEVIDMARKSRQDYLIFKVDFEEVYDSVNWGFLDYMVIGG